ncbi:MAG: hypothetical protein DME60_13040 [Verrucomicrobia bacterium]|nr:MAG: hypothetical protein DME60_13040 [Verrucomicrobiota bacterium]
MNTNKHEFRKPETLVNAWLGSFPNENTCLVVSSCREHISIATPAGQSRSAAGWFTEYDKTLELPSKGLASVVCCAADYRAPDDKSATLKKSASRANK